jgi:hypothetical protein
MLNGRTKAMAPTAWLPTASDAKRWRRSITATVQGPWDYYLVWSEAGFALSEHTAHQVEKFKSWKR